MGAASREGASLRLTRDQLVELLVLVLVVRAARLVHGWALAGRLSELLHLRLLPPREGLLLRRGRLHAFFLLKL